MVYRYRAGVSCFCISYFSNLLKPVIRLGFFLTFVRNMKLFQACRFGSLLIFASSSLAAILPNVEDAEAMGLVPRQQATSTRVADAACTNGPNTRACWRTGYSIATDFDAKSPPEGKTVVHNLEITNITLAPDGKERLVMAINGQYRMYQANHLRFAIS